MLLTIFFITVGGLIYGLGMIEDVPPEPEVNYRPLGDVLKERGWLDE